MSANQGRWAAYGSTALFVLLWSGGAIFAKWGLAHASAFAFLLWRFVLALALLALLGLRRRRWLPAPGSRGLAAATGLTLIGGYTIFYLLALDRGITPGVLATLLGAQPILTLALTERRFPAQRLAGLLLAMGGLALVMLQGIVLARFSPAGMACALAALLCMTGGAMLQKRLGQPPMDVLPLQYVVGLLACLACVPFQPMQVRWSWEFLVPLIWMAWVISVGATLLFYRMIQTGNLVNVTSLFYLVPVGTAALDYLVFGNRMSGLSLAGMAAILGGLLLVFNAGPRREGRF
ncbi:DMT family transporter [Achromobacter sp. Marseille-Q4962]|uniref:DMT family transporter n=1 Tax=Achromobacter sp. Marseille-Q4962 TaxID=2942202 RepID=UPI0020738C95|nr:DMT family transporter [Achromobacter sp. Marseille-Q4962]